jgi:hypothetical protein
MSMSETDHVDAGAADTSKDATSPPDSFANSTGGPPPKFIQLNFDRMPPELKLLKNWVLWAAVWNGI